MNVEIADYIYWQYSVAVLLVTELIRVLTKDTKIASLKLITVDRPKWISLIVAVILAVLDYSVFNHGKSEFDLWKFIISFGVAVLGYDYVVKLVKEWVEGQRR